MLRWMGIAAAALLVSAHEATGQSRDTVSRAYQVRGYYEDTEMPPWQASLRVADSTLDGPSATQVRYRSRFVLGRWLYDYVAVWSGDGHMRARMLGDGRAGKTFCELSHDAGTIEGITEQGPLTAKVATGIVIPDFALAGYLSTLRVAAGDTVHVSVVKCLSQFGAAGISVVPFMGVVRASQHVHVPGSTPVAAWEIRSGGEYPAEVVVRKSDGVVLRVKTPQGENAYSIDALVP